jgi:hypothetical protein
MARTRIDLYHPGIDAVLSRTTAALKAEAESRASAARATAPVKSGAYRDSIHVEMTSASALGIPLRSSKNRPVAIVVADVDYALEVEANTGNLRKSL